MTDHGYPFTCYGVEAHTDRTGWVLLDNIHRTCTDATKHRQSLTGPFGFGAGDLRVVALTITRKEETRNDHE